MRFLSPLFSILLAPLVAVAPVMAQMPVPSQGGDALALSSLQLRVLGNDPGAPAGSRSPRGITVEVSDGAGNHVSNAAVVFRLPDSGPSATFADGSLTAIAYTDSSGRAQVADIHWGPIPGLVNMRITAAKGTTHAGLLLPQTLTAPQTIPVPQVTASRPPTTVAAPPNSPARPLAPGIIDEAKLIPAVTVEHRSVHSQITGEDAAPVQAKAIPVSAALADDEFPDANVPIRHMVTTGADEAEAPRVSVSSAGPASSGGHSKAKWLIALAVAAGAGAAALLLTHSSGAGSSPSSSSGVSIGSPTVSVGHP